MTTGGFHSVIVLSMTITFLTYFLIIPLIHPLAQKYHTTASSTWQLGTIYEAAKCIGAVAMGAMGTRMGPLTVIIYGFALYALLTALLALHVLLDPFGTGAAGFAGLFALYGAVSTVCIVSQLGMAVMRSTATSTAHFYDLVALQGIVATLVQAASPFASSALSAIARQTSAPFFAMSGIGILSSLALAVLRPPAHAASVDKHEEGSSAPPPSFSSQLWQLCTRSHFMIFRRYVAVLGVATASLYIWPLAANLALTQVLGCSNVEASLHLLVAFAANLCVRALSLSPLRSFMGTSDNQIIAGLVLLIGAAALALAVESLYGSTFASILVPGVMTMAGVGAVMPNCKAGAMISVPEQMNSTATSTLKISQLVIVAILQAVSALSTGSASQIMRNQAAILFAAKSLCVALYLWTLYKRALPGVAPSAGTTSDDIKIGVNQEAPTNKSTPVQQTDYTQGKALL